MTKSTITRERLEEIRDYDTCVTLEESAELARMVLAAMDSEPVAWTDEQELRDVDRGGCGYLFTVNPVTPHADERRIILLYRHAQPASEREQVRREHAEWSQATFGNVGPVGPLKHLSKEALEAAAEPGDLSEWADMQFLIWDAQRRAGITDDQITQAMIDKLAVNKQRSWPEPKEGEPRLHIKEQPASVVQCPYPCGWDNLNKLAIQDAALVARGLVEGEPTTDAQRQAAVSNNDRLLKVISACRAAMLAAANCSIPMISDKWIPVSEQMPPSRHEVLVGCWWAEKPRWCCKWATYIPGHPDAQSSGWVIPGASWTPTHWMPLPNPPKE